MDTRPYTESNPMMCIPWALGSIGVWACVFVAWRFV